MTYTRVNDFGQHTDRLDFYGATYMWSDLYASIHSYSLEIT